jgi:glyoxylase-like metal-dependent hydrolase (beta-lactamase superfamily II)/8-oxo-dGTP pyrophosphatase MutT (NUDIX family)
LSAVRDAATVVLVRNRADPEVYWVRRAAGQRFLPGFHVFPGGVREETDASVEATAVRELAEEAGVVVDASALVPAGRWLTPPFGPIRFDTRFYVADMPDGAHAQAADGELDGGEWIRPADALARWERAEALVAPPTLHALRCLADGLTDVARRMSAVPEADRGDVTRIEFVRGVFVLPLRTPTLPPATHTNMVIFAGERAVVIDPATPHEDERRRLDGLVDVLRAEGVEIAEIVLTHHHADHVAYADALRRRVKAPIAAHDETAARLDFPVDRRVGEGEAWDLGRGMRARVVHTPGHTRGHLAVLEERTRTLAAGDLVAGASYVVVDPDDGGDMGAYVESLRKARGLAARLLLPAHGPASAAPERQLDEYVTHRLQREAKVLGAVRGGATTVEAVLPIAYADTPQAMWPIARSSLRAHLDKLVRDGAVTFAGGAYRAVTVR